MTSGDSGSAPLRIAGTGDVLESVPVRDSVMAVADERYFDWPVVPEAPSGLTVSLSGGTARLSWETHGGHPAGLAVERRAGNNGKWERIAKLPASAAQYVDSNPASGQVNCYRVRAVNDAGESAYSNIARISR